MGENLHDFSGRVAVITGAASGAGRALAHACAADGMRVVVADIESGPAETVATAICDEGGEAIAVTTDVADAISVKALAERTYAEFGEANLLFENAGIMRLSPLVDAEPSDWNWVLAVNLWGVINGVQAFLPHMREQSGLSQIVITASMSGLVARRNLNGIYTAVKHGVVGYANVLRDELEPEGIGVSCWCPGGMKTQIRNAARVRQPEFGGPHVPPPHRFPQMPDAPLPEDFMPRVLQGARENRRYIFSHPGTRSDLQEYYEALFADFDAGERTALELS